jgi:hypothetical protein
MRIILPGAGGNFVSTSASMSMRGLIVAEDEKFWSVCGVIILRESGKGSAFNSLAFFSSDFRKTLEISLSFLPGALVKK